MSNPTEELKACPFKLCDGDIRVHQEWSKHYVECLSCGARGPKFTRRETAIEWWNTRAPAEQTTRQPSPLESARDSRAEEKLGHQTTQSGDDVERIARTTASEIRQAIKDYGFTPIDPCLIGGETVIERAIKAAITQAIASREKEITELKAKLSNERTEDTERTRFEAWVSAPPFECSVDRNPESDAQWPGQYYRYAVQLAWEAWTEGAKHEH